MRDFACRSGEIFFQTKPLGVDLLSGFHLSFSGAGP